MHTTFHDRNRHNAGIWFTGHRVGGALRAGDDAIDAAFFALDDLPTPLAFDTDERVIERLRENALTSRAATSEASCSPERKGSKR